MLKFYLGHPGRENKTKQKKKNRKGGDPEHQGWNVTFAKQFGIGEGRLCVWRGCRVICKAVWYCRETPVCVCGGGDAESFAQRGSG